MKKKSVICITFLIISNLYSVLFSMDPVSGFYNKSLDSVEYLEKNNYLDHDENLQHDVCWENDFKECVRLIKGNDLEGLKKYFDSSSINLKNINRRYEYKDKEEAEFLGSNEDKKTLLMIAVEKGNKEIVEFLIEKGANINAFYGKALPEYYEESPKLNKWSQFNALSLAVIKNNLDMVKLLFYKGANLDCFNEYSKKGEAHGYMHYCEPEEFYCYGSEKFKCNKARLLGMYLNTYDSPNLEIIRTLFEYGYKLNIGYEIDYDYPQEDCLIAYILKIRKFDLELAKLLFNNIEYVGDSLFTIFHCLRGYAKNIEFAKYLIESDKFDVNFNLEESILQCAVSILQSLEYVKYLIDKGANVNFLGYEKTDPLMMACLVGLPSIAKELLTAGADLSYRKDEYDSDSEFEHSADVFDKKEKSSALDIAKKSENKELIELLENWPKVLSQEVEKTTPLISDVSGIVAEYLTGQEIKKENNGFVNYLEKSVNKKKRPRDNDTN